MLQIKQRKLGEYSYSPLTKILPKLFLDGLYSTLCFLISFQSAFIPSSPVAINKFDSESQTLSVSIFFDQLGDKMSQSDSSKNVLQMSINGDEPPPAYVVEGCAVGGAGEIPIIDVGVFMPSSSPEPEVLDSELGKLRSALAKEGCFQVSISFPFL